MFASKIQAILRLTMLGVAVMTVFYFSPFGQNIAYSLKPAKSGLGSGDCGSGTIVWCCSTSDVSCGGTCSCGGSQ